MDQVLSHSSSLNADSQKARGSPNAHKRASLAILMEQEGLLEENHVLTRLRLLSRVAQIAAGELELSLLLSLSLCELERHIPLHTCSVWLADFQELLGHGKTPDGTEDLRDCSYTKGPPVSWVLATNNRSSAARAVDLGLAPGRRLSTEQTPFGACLKSGQALYADLSRLRELGDDLCHELAERGASVFFAIPLAVGERTVGLLQSVATHTSGFTGEQIQLLYIVADLLGPAISNRQLVERLRTAYGSLRAAQNKLVQTEKMRALGELAAGVAHNFNNSLCSVLGFLEMALIDPALPASSRRLLECSRTGALNAAQTVRRVHDFSRPKELDVVVQSLDLNELIRETVELTRPKWENASSVSARPIEILLLPEAAVEVIGNSGELREVLTNLIFNAVDAMPKGGPLTVRTWSTRTDGFFSVRDAGVGMNESIQHRLFEPLFTTKGQQGTGLGLSASFGIVQRHGGEITVQSASGQGSTFTVRIPTVSRNNAKLEVMPPQSSLMTLGRARVLVIDDEESIRQFLANALTHLGYRSRLAGDGEEGLAAFINEPIDIVLTDFNLPGISGQEVARLISKRSTQTPVLLLTGKADELATQGEALEGVTRVLRKPISVETLGAALAEVCPQRP